MKKISTRQILIFYAIYSFSIKFLMLPQILATHAARDAWIVALIGTIVELVVLFIALTVLVKLRDTDIYSAARKDFKIVGAKFIVLLMLFLFILQLLILLKQIFYLLQTQMFENLSFRNFAIPMLTLGIFFCFFPARSIFRSGEIFWVFIIVAIAISIIPAVGQIRPWEVLPIFNRGAGPIWSGVYRNLIYFESASFLLIFAGDIKVEQNFRKKFMTLAILVGASFVLFVFMFYALFGPMSSTKTIAIANLTLYSSFFSNTGSMDWVLVSIWLLLLTMRFGVTFFCAFSCLRYITAIKHRAGILGASLGIAIYLLLTLVFRNMTELDSFIYHAAPAIVSLYILIPLSFYIFTLRKGGKKNA